MQPHSSIFHKIMLQCFHIYFWRKIMKNVVPSPITDENFSQAWEYANKKLVEIKKKQFTRKILVLVANTILFLCALALVLNLIIRIPSSTIEAFFDTLGPLKALATSVNPLIYHPDLHTAIQLIIYLAFLLLPAFLASAIISLIISFAYKPAAPNTETGDKAIDSKTLVDALFEAQIRGKKVEGIFSVVFTGSFLVAILALATYLYIFVMNNSDILANDVALTLAFQTLASNPILATALPALMQGLPVIFIAIFGLYAALNEILSSLLKPFYKTEIAPEIQNDAKNYYYECNPAIKEAYEEEERILERAIEIKLKRRQEEADLMAKINYQNPVYKYVKIGIITLALIIALVIAGNKMKSLDIENFFHELGFESVEENTESTETEVGTEVTNE